MKRYLILLLVVFASTATRAQNHADKIIGVWLNEEKTTKIEIFKNGSSYSGKVIWLAQLNDVNGNPRLDKNNPDPDKRNQKILGLTIITGLKYSKNKWSGGSIYGPNRGQYANCSLILKSSGELQITVTKGVFSETKIWTKI
ncbi:MAG TPA: hypothetical protein DCG75_10870 [Bacteroidales bacterium]|nr:hypothetical protein [Bacteroidales bacterium]